MARARWLIVISFLVTYFDHISLSSIQPLIQKLRQVIDTNYKNCPGFILVLDQSFDQDYIEKLVTNFGPVVVLQTDSISSLSLEQHQPEVVCYHLVHFTFHLQQFKIEQMHDKLKKMFYLKLTIIVIVSELEVVGDLQQLLQNAQSEDIIIIKAFNTSLKINNFQVYRWRVDGRIHQHSDTTGFLEVRRTSNLMGRKLRIGTLHFPPAVFITNNTNNISSVYGVESELINLLSSSLNFTIDYIFSGPNEMWGNIITQEDGKVEGYGLRIMLYRKEIDAAFGELYFHDKWDKYFSFSEAFKTNHECFLVPSPKPYPRWMAVIFPFSLSTWIATFFSLILAVVTLNLVARWTKKNNRDSYFEDGILSCLYIVGNLLNVPQPREIHSMPNRLFMFAWLFAAAIASSAYCSGLISFLTQPSSPTPIQTIEQLVKSPLNKATFFKFAINSIINSTDPNRHLLGQQLTVTYNISYMFSLLDSGEWAVDSTIDRLLYEADLRYSKNKDPPCYLMKECILPTRSSFGLQKNSPLKQYFDRKILRFVETGLVKYHRSQFVKELRHNTVQQQAVSKEMVRFSLSNLQGAFYLFVCGVMISFIVFLLELTVQHFRKIDHESPMRCNYDAETQSFAE